MQRDLDADAEARGAEGSVSGIHWAWNTKPPDRSDGFASINQNDYSFTSLPVKCALEVTASQVYTPLAMELMSIALRSGSTRC